VTSGGVASGAVDVRDVRLAVYRWCEAAGSARGAEQGKKRRTYLPIPTWLPVASLSLLRFWGFFCLCFTKHFRGVFELLVQRNGQKRDKTNQRKQRQGTKIPSFFLKRF
jgi:hypothetical protein